jgi:ethanolamine utilization protein EutP (predicted NTPase)
VLERLPSVLLRVEGLVMAVAAVVLYFHLGHPWWLLALLVLAPDLSMIGYLAGVRPGAAAYDLAHLDALPVALGAAGVVSGSDVAVELALVWLVHVGADRALGYGLKYPTRFEDTHLQRV